MHSSKREVLGFIYSLMVILNIMLAQPSFEFMNENATEILFDLKDEVVLQRENGDILYDGSGTIIEFSTYTTINVTLISTELSSVSSTQSNTLIESIASSSITLVSDTFPTSTSTPIIITSMLSTDDTSSYMAISDTTQQTKNSETTTQSMQSPITSVTTFTTDRRSEPQTSTDSTYKTSFDYRQSSSHTETSTNNFTAITTEIPNTTFATTSSSTTATTTTTTPYNPENCSNRTEIRLLNGTCIAKADAQEVINNILSNSSNSTEKAAGLVAYCTLESGRTLLPKRIDAIVRELGSQPFEGNSTAAFITVQPITEHNSIVLGASFKRGSGGETVREDNKERVLRSSLSTAGIISNESLHGINSLNMLIIDEPLEYRNTNISTNKTLVSSVIVASLPRNNSSPISSTNISLYFQVLEQWKPNTTTNVDYYCSFYDTNNQQWNESGCTTPTYNQQFNRYECTCNHLTSFALLWLPQTSALYTPYLNAQDIASLVFQSLSIICFLFILIHAIVIKVNNPLLMTLKPYDLLPLVSCASTTLLFIFYIALGMTVYTKTTSQSQTQCFQSSSVLMFIVYFLLIFMFCTKTSVGYFNYLRFVYLFPQPSLRKLFYMLILSFMISLICVLLAIGFNSNASFEITYLYAYKLCWFNRRVIYYFLTIPVCIFLLINIVLFVVVTIRIVHHVQRATSPHQSYERMKRCILVLLSSCLTQGIGWLFGPFLTIVNATAGEVLGWFFIIFNGLEGVYSLILYIIIVQQHMSERKRVIAYKDLIQLASLSSKKTRKLGRNYQTAYENSHRKRHISNNDLHHIQCEDLRSSEC